MSEVPTPQQPDRPDYAAMMDKLREKVLDSLVHAHERFPGEKACSLSGAELREALKLHNNLTVVLERVIELNAERDEMERRLVGDPNDEDALAHKREIAWLAAMPVLAEASFLPYLKKSAHKRGLDPSPYVRCSQNLTFATRADAIALSERLEMAADDESKTVGNAPAVAVQAMDPKDLAILEFLNRTPTIRRLISDVIPDSGPQNRGAITARLKQLAARTPPLVDYPKKKDEGVAILPAGIELLNQAKAELTALQAKTAHK